MTSTPEAERIVVRASALAALEAAFGAAEAGHGRLLLVAGEAGIGKTTVLVQAGRHAARRGALVLEGQCWAGDGTPGYWPWIQILRDGVAAGGDPGAAAAMLADGSGSNALPADLSPDGRFRMFDAATQMLHSLAGDRTVVIVVDDLHWADAGSLQLLEFVARHISTRRVLVLAAYRDDEADRDLLSASLGAEHIALDGLSRTEVATVISAMSGTAPPASMVEDVWRRTGGNPFLVGELTRLSLAQGRYDIGAAARGALLETVREILGRRLARLSQRCVELLTVAAVCGPSVPIERLRLMSDDQASLPGLLLEAVGARVLEEPMTPDEPYRFSHDLFRETILAGLPPDARASLHLEVARALEAARDASEPVHPAELAAHFCAALPHASTDASSYSILAGRDAEARLAFEEASAHYERALSALGLSDDGAGGITATRMEVLLRLGDARTRAGRSEAALDSYRRAADMARRMEDATALARCAIGVHSLGWRHSHAISIELLDEAASSLPAEAVALRARVLASLARDLHHSHREQDWDRAMELAERAVAIAREVGEADTIAYCLLALHDTRWRRGSAKARLPVIDEMSTTAISAEDPQLEAQSCLLRAGALLELGDPRGLAELDSYCRQCEKLGDARARYGALSRRATIALLEGRLADAESKATEALALGIEVGEVDAVGVHETLLWAVHRVGGDGSPTWVPRLDSDPWPEVPVAEAVMHVLAGEVEEAQRVLAPLDVDRLPLTYDLEALAFAAEVVAVAGSGEQRAALYDALLPYGGTHIVVGGCASYFGAADHYLGILARSAGRVEQARRHFDDAVALHEMLGAVAWSNLSRAEADTCVQRDGPDEPPALAFRREVKVWAISYGSERLHVPDSKGICDLAVLVGRPGQRVHAVELHTGSPPHAGADAVLDDAAKAAYRRRLAELDEEIEVAASRHDPHGADAAEAERDALIAELSSAAGIGHRDRRLGSETERARKAVSARIRVAVQRIEQVSPCLAEHLQRSIQTGTWCVYAPDEAGR